MDQKELLNQLLREYGYPQEVINRFMEDTETDDLTFEEAKKRIMPYKDITAERSQY